MLFDLKIETIGKIMSSILLVCFSLVFLKYLPMEFTEAAGENGKIWLEPSNGIIGSNKLDVWINTDGFSPSVVTIKYTSANVGTISYEKNNSLPSLVNLTAGGTATIPTLTLSKTGGTASLTPGNYKLFTIVSNPTTTTAGNVSTIEGGASFMTDGTSTYPLVTASGKQNPYPVSANDAPQVTITIPGTDLTSVPYNTKVQIRVQDLTDNSFNSHSAILYKGPVSNNGAWASSTQLSEYYNITPFTGIISESTVTLELKTGKYLDYSIPYKISASLKDDQGVQASSDVTFEIQADQTPPPAPESVKVTRMNWSNTPGATVMNFEFRGKSLHEPFVPENIEKFIVFRRTDIGNSLVKNSEGGVLSWSGDGNYFNTTIKPKLISAETTAGSSVTISLSSALKDNDRFEASLKNTDLGINNIKDNFLKDGTIYFIVAKDKGGNYSQPVHIIKLGDVRGTSTYGLPDGRISLEDGKYIFQNGKDPEACPIPAPVSIPSYSPCAKAN